MKKLFIGLGLSLLLNNIYAYDDEPGACLSDDEYELAQLVNAYRQENGLDSIPISRSLTEVAQYHAWDLITNAPDDPDNCNLHSWSNMPYDGVNWQSVCYNENPMAFQQMWDKPEQITNNVYTGDGYENAYWHSIAAEPGPALEAWKNSPGHNSVILNINGWEILTFNALGVGIKDNYAVLWFGEQIDPQGSMCLCSTENLVFNDGFEAGVNNNCS